jgi:peptidoglycan/LPS O-acetylase OafA/YrhL
MTNRYPSLDGWRGLAILFVLAGHLLPLGPEAWQVNSTVATTGMVIFFNLSGFLITSILLHDTNIIRFLLRRFMRIVPLAWLVLCVTFFYEHATPKIYLPHLFFYANWGDPMALIDSTSHFWSLCVEVQFYVVIATLVFFSREKAFYFLPIICVGITALRWYDSIGVAINTYYRVDEILAGSILALLYKRRDAVANWFCWFNPLVIFPLVLISAHPQGNFIQYFRPYLSLLLIGSTLFGPRAHPITMRFLSDKSLFYIATVSYALYVLHGGLRHTWLGEGDTLVRYMKRPLLFAATFFLAHISTFYYENYWICLGKKLCAKIK